MLQIEVDHVEATFHRGTVYEKLGKLDEAIADFSKVLSLEPDHVKASYARGTCRNLKGDFAPAIGAFLLLMHSNIDASQTCRLATNKPASMTVASACSVAMSPVHAFCMNC